MRPDPFKGPLLPDVLLALAGIPAGGLVGFWIGAFAQVVRPVKMSDFVLYGGAILGTFTLWLVLWSRIT